MLLSAWLLLLLLAIFLRAAVVEAVVPEAPVPERVLCAEPPAGGAPPCRLLLTAAPAPVLFLDRLASGCGCRLLALVSRYLLLPALLPRPLVPRADALDPPFLPCVLLEAPFLSCLFAGTPTSFLVDAGFPAAEACLPFTSLVALAAHSPVVVRGLPPRFDLLPSRLMATSADGRLRRLARGSLMPSEGTIPCN